jgi:hypothetical protein
MIPSPAPDATDPYAILLTIKEVSILLGVSCDFVTGEIIDRRLHAEVQIKRPSGRTHRKVTLGDLREYCVRWCPRALPRLAELYSFAPCRREASEAPEQRKPLSSPPNR